MTIDSPDVSPYVYLPLTELTAQSLIELAINDALVKLPAWEPREGHQEVVVIEALAAELGTFAQHLNLLPGAITEVLLRLFDVQRDLGSPAVMDLTFTVADDLGHTIPAGTRARLEPVAGARPVVVATTFDLVIDVGDTEGTIQAMAMEVGTWAHEALVGATLQLLDTVTYVEAVTLDTVAAGGRDPESAPNFLTRGTTRLRGLVDVLVLPDQFLAAALGAAGVGRARAVDEYDPNQAGSPGDHEGHITVVAGGTDGLALSGPDAAALEADLEARAVVHLEVHVVAPTITVVPITVEVQRLETHTAATVEANVEAVLEAYLDPARWPWEGTVRRNELIARIDAAVGVDYVIDLTLPAADVVLDDSAVGPLADLGAITVTVAN